MTNNNIHAKNNTLNSVGKTANKIKLSMYKGVLNGNIIDNPIMPPIPPPTPVCEPYSLDFSCEDNSEYIAAI